MAGTGAVTLGKDCKIYRNTNTYASPTWVEFTDVRDLKIGLEMDEADASTRYGLGWKESEPALLSATPEWESLFDVSDATYLVLEAAFFARTAIEFAIMNGNVATPTNRGLRAKCKLFGFDRDEPLADTVKVAMKLRAVKNVDSAPAWFIIP